MKRTDKRGHQNGARTLAGKQGQQEIVGFVLIVVIVIVGLMMFLIYSFRDHGESFVGGDLGVANLLSSILSSTSPCVVNDEVQTMGGLFANCYKGVGCDNLDGAVCDILHEEVGTIINSSFKTETMLNGMRLEFYVDEGAELVQGVQDFESVSVGVCTTNYFRGFEQEVPRLDNVYVKLVVC